MHFTIEHLTAYRYSVPVSLGTHRLRFLPREVPGQRLLDYRLAVDPAPEWIGEYRDPWDNRVQELRFAGTTDRLVVDVHMEVETSRFGPGDASMSGPVEECLRPLDADRSVREFAEPEWRASGGDRRAFLDRLNRRLRGVHHRGVRIEGGPRTPAETIARGDGVCRDLAVLFMAVCRDRGIPARFVSGYQQGTGSRAERYLHAWAEAWLAETGWLAFDQTHGGDAGETHVAVAAVCSPEEATPVDGGYTFNGERLTSTLDAEIRITTRP